MSDVVWCAICKSYGHFENACPGIDTGRLPLVPEDKEAKEKQALIEHAEFLIKNGYVKGVELDKLVERIQKKSPDKFDSYDLE